MFLLLTEALALLEQVSSHLNEEQLRKFQNLKDAISSGNSDFDNYNYE